VGRRVDVGLREYEVSRLRFDHAVVLEMAGAELRIETPFTLRVVGSPRAHDVFPDRVGDTGSMMLGLLREVILDVVVEESGHLGVEFPGTSDACWTPVTPPPAPSTPAPPAPPAPTPTAAPRRPR
jgi:hypothetical protein